MSSLLRRGMDIGEFVRRDPVLAVAIVLAVVSCVAVPPDAAYLSYVDLRTLGLLFSLMTVMAGLTRLGVFRAACRRLLAVARTPRTLALSLVLLAFFSSMFITNDVALVTFVPLALLALGTLGSTGLTCFTVAIMTIAANLGSMFTPIGNPQNLYLYSASHLSLGGFLQLMLPYTLLALVLLVVAVLLFGRVECGQGHAAADSGAPAGSGSSEASHAPAVSGADRESAERIAPAALAPWVVLFALALLCVAHILPFELVAVAAVVIALAADRGALRHVDYGLLVTFVAFFVFVGNVGRIGVVEEFIARMVDGHELLVAAASSQVLSNVPAAILLSGFTDRWAALIVGTNLGGLGTLIASMASLISYKQLALVMPRAKGRYLALFTMWNVVFLAVLLAAAALLG